MTERPATGDRLADEVSRRITLVADPADPVSGEVSAFLRAAGLEVITWDQAVAWTGRSAASAHEVLESALRRTAGIVVALGAGSGEPAAIAGLAAATWPARTLVLQVGRGQVDPALWGSAGFRLSDDGEMRSVCIERLALLGAAASSNPQTAQAGDFSGLWRHPAGQPLVPLGHGMEPDPSTSVVAALGPATLGLAQVDFELKYDRKSSFLRRNSLVITHHAGAPLLDVMVMGRTPALRFVNFLGSPIAEFPAETPVPFSLEPDPPKLTELAIRIVARTVDDRMVIFDAVVQK